MLNSAPSSRPTLIIEKRYSFHNQLLVYHEHNFSQLSKVRPGGTVIFSTFAMKSVCCFGPLRKLFGNGIWSREYLRAIMKRAAGKGKCAFFKCMCVWWRILPKTRICLLILIYFLGSFCFAVGVSHNSLKIGN